MYHGVSGHKPVVKAEARANLLSINHCKSKCTLSPFCLPSCPSLWLPAHAHPRKTLSGEAARAPRPKFAQEDLLPMGNAMFAAVMAGSQTLKAPVAFQNAQLQKNLAEENARASRVKVVLQDLLRMVNAILVAL